MSNSDFFLNLGSRKHGHVSNMFTMNRVNDIDFLLKFNISICPLTSY